MTEADDEAEETGVLTRNVRRIVSSIGASARDVGRRPRATGRGREDAMISCLDCCVVLGQVFAARFWISGDIRYGLPPRFSLYFANITN